jgi:hypothetical protein
MSLLGNGGKVTEVAGTQQIQTKLSTLGFLSGPCRHLRYCYFSANF